MKMLNACRCLLICCATLVCGAQNTRQNLGPGETRTFDREEPRYELVFPPSYEGKIRWKFDEYERITESQQQAFITEMNRLGGAGYRLKASVYGLPTAIVVQDEGKYEYDRFEARSSFPFVKNGLAENLLKLNESGFGLVGHLSIGHLCNISDLADPVLIETCKYRDLFIVEKQSQSQSKKRVEQMVISSPPGWGSRTSVDMTAEINSRLKDGFYPVKLISKFEVVLEKDNLAEEPSKNKAGFQVVRSDSRNELEKKVNKLAEQGYRLAFTENGIALLYRNDTTFGVPVSYKWVSVNKRNFEKDLDKLDQMSARYCTAYPDSFGFKTSLIFEIGRANLVKRSEHKILRLSFVFTENPSEEKVYIDLDTASKQQLEKMDELSKEGFLVRDLFQSNNIEISKGARSDVILERTQ